MITPDASLLSIFHTIVEQGSLSRAALHLNISQPALSMKISQLEHQLGVPLLERGARGVTPTHYGLILNHYSKTIETTRWRAAVELNARSEGSSGELMIGASPIALARLIPQAMKLLIDETGILCATILEGPDDKLDEMLLQHEIDVVVGVVGLQAPSKEIREAKLKQDQLCIVFKPCQSLNHFNATELLHLKEYPWAIPIPGSLFRKQVDAIFIASGVPIPCNVIRCDSFLAVRQLCMAGNIFGILPDKAIQVEINAGELTAVPIDGPAATRWIGYRVRRDEHIMPLAARFIEILESSSLRKEDISISM